MLVTVDSDWLAPVGGVRSAQVLAVYSASVHDKQINVSRHLPVHVGVPSTEALHMVAPQVLLSVPLNAYPVLQL